MCWAALDAVSAPHIHRPFFVARPGRWFTRTVLATLQSGMKTLILRLALLSAIAFAALALVAPAAADDEGGDATAAEETGSDVVPAALWSLAGVAIGAVVMGTLYLFKRRVGGFPENPSWVAPITIMRSRDLPSDSAGGQGDAHDSHGATHAPAH